MKDPETLAEAFQIVGRSVDMGGFFLNSAWAAVAIGIFAACWIAQWIVGWVLWKILMCGRPGSVYNKQESVDSPSHLPVSTSSQRTMDVLLQQAMDGGPNATAEPVYSKLDNSGVPRFLHARVQPRPSGAKIVYEKFPPEQSSNWHKYRRSRYESFVRLVIISVRILIVLAGTLFAFFVAGVNLYSLVAGFGLVSLGFSYAMATMISNIFSAVYMYATYKVELHDYVECVGVRGEVTALRGQWFEITDDLQPMRGRTIHHIPNKIPMETIFTHYPDGPPPFVIEEYKRQLDELEKKRGIIA